MIPGRLYLSRVPFFDPGFRAASDVTLTHRHTKPPLHITVNPHTISLLLLLSFSDDLGERQTARSLVSNYAPLPARPRSRIVSTLNAGYYRRDANTSFFTFSSSPLRLADVFPFYTPPSGRILLQPTTNLPFLSFLRLLWLALVVVVIPTEREKEPAKSCRLWIREPR